MTEREAERDIQLQIDEFRIKGLSEMPSLHQVAKALRTDSRTVSRFPIWTEEVQGGKKWRRTSLRRLARFMVTGR